MAAIITPDQLIARISAGMNKQESSFFNPGIIPAGPMAGNSRGQRAVNFRDIPSTLETGVTAYIPTELFIQVTTSIGGLVLFGEYIDLGSLNLSTNVFTDGSSMPTRTVFNTSVPLHSPIFVETEASINSTPGSLTITYVDQNGNTAETTASMLLSGGNANVGQCSTAILNTIDVGARDITTAARSGGTSPVGTLRFWGIIPIAMVTTGNQTASTGGSLDLINTGIIRRLPAGARIGGWIQNQSSQAFLSTINYVGDA